MAAIRKLARKLRGDEVPPSGVGVHPVDQQHGGLVRFSPTSGRNTSHSSTSTECSSASVSTAFQKPGRDIVFAALVPARHSAPCCPNAERSEYQPRGSICVQVPVGRTIRAPSVRLWPTFVGPSRSMVRGEDKDHARCAAKSDRGNQRLVDASASIQPRRAASRRTPAEDRAAGDDRLPLSRATSRATCLTWRDRPHVPAARRDSHVGSRCESLTMLRKLFSRKPRLDAEDPAVRNRRTRRSRGRRTSDVRPRIP